MSAVDKIRELCKQKGISIKALEQELGYSNGSITKPKTLPADRLHEIAKYFKVSMEYLLSDAEEETYYINPETAKTAQDVFEDPELRILFNAARNAKPEDIKLAAEMLKRLKETNPDG